MVNYICPKCNKNFTNKSKYTRHINRIIPCYFTFPRVGANPKFASFSSKFVFPITDILLRKFSDPDMAKVVYFSVSVNSNSI